MNVILAIVALGFAQRYLGWGDWVWFLFVPFAVLHFLMWVEHEIK